MLPNLFSVTDDVIKWKYFPRYWPFVREIHRSPVNFPHKGQWRGALMFTLICARMNGWVNNSEAGDLRRYLAHYDVIVMLKYIFVYHRGGRQRGGGTCCTCSMHDPGFRWKWRRRRLGIRCPQLRSHLPTLYTWGHDASAVCGGFSCQGFGWCDRRSGVSANDLNSRRSRDRNI